jgi:hypothetical protein
MPIQMFKGKISKVVDNRDVRQHRKDGWTYKPSTTVASKPKQSRRRIKVKDSTVIKATDLAGPIDQIEETNYGD